MGIILTIFTILFALTVFKHIEQGNPIILNINCHISQLGIIRKIANIKNFNEKSNWEKLNKTDKKKFLAIAGEISKKLSIQLTFFYNLNSIFIRRYTKDSGEISYFLPFSEKQLAEIELGKIKKKEILFRLQRRTLHAHHVISGYLMERSGTLGEAKLIRVLFDFPEKLLAGRFRFLPIPFRKKVLAKIFKLKYESYSDFFNDVLNETHVFTNYTYKNKYCTFSQAS